MVKNNPNLPLIGGVIAGVAASACCVGPLVLLMLGISGSWISSLTDLEPYRPIFIGISLLFVVLAYRKIYIKKEGDDCVEGEICAFLELSVCTNIYSGLLSYLFYWHSYHHTSLHCFTED